MAEKGKKEEVKAEDYIEIPVGAFMKRLKTNPWFLISLVLFVALIVFIVLYFSGENSVGEEKVRSNLASFLGGRISDNVQIGSITKESGLYKVDVSYQGESVPLYVTADGKSLIYELVPLE